MISKVFEYKLKSLMMLMRVIVEILKILKGLIYLMKKSSQILTKFYVSILNFQVMEAKKLSPTLKKFEIFLSQLRNKDSRLWHIWHTSELTKIEA